MSLAATAWAWTVRGLTMPQRIVLLRLADRARNGDGRTWPSVETLAEEVEMAESTTRQAIRDLEDRRLVRVDKTRGRVSNTYTLPVANPPAHDTQPTGSRWVNPPAHDTQPTGSRHLTHRLPAPNLEGTYKEPRVDRPATPKGRPSDAQAGTARRVDPDDPVGRAEAARLARDRQAADCPRCDDHGLIEHEGDRWEVCDHQRRAGHA